MNNLKYQKRFPLQNVSEDASIQLDEDTTINLKALILSIPDVYFRSGVWNEYKKLSSKIAYDNAARSPYGADIIINYNDAWYNGEVDARLLIYITCPCESDMW